MAFKIKDLMINDLSKTGFAGPHPERTCNPITRAICFDTFDQATPIYFCLCTFGSGGAPFDPSDPGESLTSLETLKEQLKQQLDQIEKRQSDLGKNLAPQTVEEVDDLSAKLREALEHLSQLRAELAAATQRRA